MTTPPGHDRLCVIPARSGSKRLPGKNIRLLAGKPLLAYSIDAARDSGCFDTVYVATDDRAIADAAQAHGAVVPELVPAALCADDIASHEPCLHLAQRLGFDAGLLACLQPTSPLRGPEDIRAGLARAEAGDVDAVVSVTPIDPHYFHWAVAPRTDGCWQMFFKDRFMRERSELPEVFRPNGAIKIATLVSLRRVGHFFGPRMGVVQTPEERSVHVGTAFDFEVCERLLEARVGVQ